MSRSCGMSPKQSSKNTPKIDPNLYGVSFSLKQCRNFDIEPSETLDWLINHAGFRRFRLMSYWDEHENTKGDLDFHQLDQQIDQIQKAGGTISLCLGARQPRWPENHWPKWAWQMNKVQRTEALMTYIQTVVNRYKNKSTIISWQLENEALLEEFGERSEVDRKRLNSEFLLIKQIDSTRPIIMTTSTSWGIPIRQPIPDIIGFSFYQIVYNKGKYNKSFHKPWLDKLRAKIIYILWHKPSYIHELQLEPWGPKNIWEMTNYEQDMSMSPTQIQKNLALAARTKLFPIDLWGGEWWYWRYINSGEMIWEAVRKSLPK